MSKKTKAEKLKRTSTKPRRTIQKKRANVTGLLPDEAMIGMVEQIMWGEFGCALIRSLGVRPIDVGMALQSRAEAEEESDASTGLPDEGLGSTVNSESPDPQEGTKDE